jgi:hypothetical protein
MSPQVRAFAAAGGANAEATERGKRIERAVVETADKLLDERVSRPPVFPGSLILSLSKDDNGQTVKTGRGDG